MVHKIILGMLCTLLMPSTSYAGDASTPSNSLIDLNNADFRRFLENNNPEYCAALEGLARSHAEYQAIQEATKALLTLVKIHDGFFELAAAQLTNDYDNPQKESDLFSDINKLTMWVVCDSLIKKIQLSEVEQLLKKGANVNGRDSSERTPLMHILIRYCGKAHEVICDATNAKELLAIAKRFLDEPSLDLTAKDDDGNSYLHYAVLSGSMELVASLQEKGLPLNILSHDNVSLVHLAASCGNQNILKLLLETTKEPIIATTEEKWTPLHCAATQENSDVCKLLLDANASLDARTTNNKTPLDIALQFLGEESEVTKYLSKQVKQGSLDH